MMLMPTSSSPAISLKISLADPEGCLQWKMAEHAGLGLV